MGFPHYILDIRDEFGDYIIDYFTDEYVAGRTPNPCVMCNTHIKWDVLLRRANKLDCEFIATGHYAQLRQENNRYIISKGIDARKDQSYVLWGVSQESLARTRFPLGHMHKHDIRELARTKGFYELANKSESYEICFIPDNDYRGFLKRRVPELEAEVAGGQYLDLKGNVIGSHEGYPFYTIGQRKGLGITLGEPAYVVDINKEKNTIVLGPETALQRQGMWVNKLNMSKYPSVEGEPFESVTKVRYKHAGTPAILEQQGDRMRVLFGEPVSAIAPGQAAVFYEGNDVVGGGWIQDSFQNEQEDGATWGN